MSNKSILIVEDDPELATYLKDALGKEYVLEIVASSDLAEEKLKQLAFDLIIIDFDLRREESFQVFRKIHPLRPAVKVLVLSTSGSIPLAVHATKAGVAEFLQKPLHIEQLKESVARNLYRTEKALSLPKDCGWLRGESAALDTMVFGIEEIVSLNSDLFLVGGVGIDKRVVAEIIHAHGYRRQRKLAMLDLLRFKKEAHETNFWTILQDMLALPDLSSLRDEKDRCGTVFLENFDALDEYFRASLLEFVRSRKGNLDRAIRVILGVEKPPLSTISEFVCLSIPSLKERKEDLPSILDFYFKKYAAKHNKNILGISSAALLYLMAYDYPGNYLELETMVEQAVLLSASNALKVEDLPFSAVELMQVVSKQSLRQGLSLDEAKREFEKQLYSMVLAKLQGNLVDAARFFGSTKVALAERIEQLTAGES